MARRSSAVMERASTRYGKANQVQADDELSERRESHIGGRKDPGRLAEAAAEATPDIDDDFDEDANDEVRAESRAEMSTTVDGREARIVQDELPVHDDESLDSALSFLADAKRSYDGACAAAKDAIAYRRQMQDRLASGVDRALAAKDRERLIELPL